MKASWKDLSIALAGLVQAINQVEQIAKTGYVDSDDFTCALKSLFVSQPGSAIEVFEHTGNLHKGLETLQNLLVHYRDNANSDLARYLIGVTHIQKKLQSKRELLKVIGSRLEAAEKQVQMFGLSHDNVIRNIAAIYTDTISKFQYRIQVSGNYNYLQQERVANQIRTLLLCAIRAATLWRQLGGSRWHFIFYRKSILDAVEELLQEAKTRSLH